MRVQIAKQQDKLKEHHAGRPDRRSSTEPRQYESRNHWLHLKQQKCAEKNRYAVSNHPSIVTRISRSKRWPCRFGTPAWILRFDQADLPRFSIFLATNFRQKIQHSPPHKSTDKVRRKVSPIESRPNQCGAKTRRPKLRQPAGMPQLKYFQQACEPSGKNGNRNNRSAIRKNDKPNRDPEYNIRNSASMPAPPVR